jgi:hypothetical protein
MSDGINLSPVRWLALRYSSSNPERQDFATETMLVLPHNKNVHDSGRFLATSAVPTWMTLVFLSVGHTLPRSSAKFFSRNTSK